MDSAAAEKKIVRFIRSCFLSTGRKNAIVGLSGGLDSAATLALCVRALGRRRVVAVLLPSDSTPKRDIADARLLASKLGVRMTSSNIEPALYSFGSLSESKIGRANMSARVRMAVLYALAHKHNGLVAGTGDKSEFMLGYFTKHGDGAADLFPLAGLYKTEVRKLALHLGIPVSIAHKPSSPALWKGQTAEKELGFSYEIADGILRGIEKKTPKKKLETKFGKKTVRAILKRMEKNRHKLLPAPACKF